jgi:hypothetical protein
MKFRIAVLLTLSIVVSFTAHARQRAPLFRDRTPEMALTIAGDAACWVDVDNDGWTDLCAYGAVWHNNAGKGFTKMTEVGTVVAADFDNDGFVDLFSWSRLKLYHNKGGKGFEEFPLPPLPPTVSRGACWVDVNGDGLVDLYVGGYEDWDRNITYPSFLLLNEGGRSFRLAWQAAEHRTRGVTACDFKQDGKPAIYVSNYRLQPNQLFFYEGEGKMRDAAGEYNVVATSPGFAGGHSIGACWGDFDNDGEFDLFAGNFAHVDDRGDQPKSRFLKNLGAAGKYHFQDMGTCGVFYQESYATPAAGDYDNDGNLDLYFTTVYPVASFGRPNHPVLYHNDGAFTFRDASAEAGLPPLGATYQAAWADFNNDGRLDLITDGKLFVNEGASGHWLEVRLWGDGKKVNRSAIGAQVRIRLKDRTLTRQVETGTGEGNQNDLTLHFGLGAWAGPVDLWITWPNRTVQRVRHVRVDRRVDIGRKPPKVRADKLK